MLFRSDHHSVVLNTKDKSKKLANAWEQRKLGDSIDFYNGLTYSPSDIVKGDGVFVLRSSNVQFGEIVDEDNVYVRAEAVNTDNVNIGDIIVDIYSQCYSVAKELIEISKLKKGNVLIVGCSTSEVCSLKIGTASNMEVAKSIFNGIYLATKEKGLYLAVQCCEHLNRAIVIEREAVGCDGVNVVPQLKAGGALATTAYQSFTSVIQRFPYK